MIFERRDFIEMGTAGLAVSLMTGRLARAQASAAPSSGELKGGTSSVQLEGRLKAGTLKIEARDFTDGNDRALIIQGEISSVDLYSAMFSYNHDRTVFALLRDHGHSTTLVLSGSDEPKIGRVVVWNDTAGPEIFRVDKEKFMDTKNLKTSLVDGKAEIPDLVGKRQPPSFTSQELEAAFGNDTALKEFMRGRRSIHHPPPSMKLDSWICDLLSGVLGSLFPLFWAAY
jgi:hypothetical protein